MDPLTILAGLKTGLAAGKTVAGLSKQIGQFFDATDQAKKQLQKKGISSKSANATALDRWAKVRAAAEAEAELQEWITQTYGRSKWLELLKIRKEVLLEKREAEAQARRDAIERQELMVTLVGIFVLLVMTFIGATGYLHYMGWLDVRDYFP
jgi:nitrate reductase NapE component